MAKLGSYIRTPETNLINDLEQENMKLKDKVEQLQDRLDSAMEYLKEQKNTNQTIVDKTGWYIRDKVYKILKGE